MATETEDHALIRAAMSHGQSSRQTGGVYMGSMARASLYHALGLRYGHPGFDAALDNAPRVTLDALLFICQPYIDEMRNLESKAMSGTDTPPRTSSASIRGKLGRFSISTDIIEFDPDSVLAAMSGCIVVRAEAVWHKRAVDYVAMHKDFDVVPEGREPPFYTWHMTQNADGTITRMLVKQA
jgi:hypothetical protein